MIKTKIKTAKYSECTSAVEIIYNTLEDAMKVRDELKNIASTYGFASLADYYELASYHFTQIGQQILKMTNHNLSNTMSNFANTKYGWSATSLKYVTIDCVDAGYIISLPYAYKIEKTDISEKDSQEV